MDNEAMQRLTRALEDAKSANRAAAVALHALEDDEPVFDNLGACVETDDARAIIGRTITATDYSTDDNGTDEAATELEWMIADALSVRFSKTAHMEWQQNGGYTLTATMCDDGTDIASITVSGTTKWDAVVRLAQAAGYFTPGDF